VTEMGRRGIIAFVVYCLFINLCFLHFFFNFVVVYLDVVDPFLFYAS
jgi:hypothetical protein